MQVNRFYWCAQDRPLVGKRGDMPLPAIPAAQPTVKSASSGVARFVMSSARKDRVGDVIEQNWDLSGFKQNPVALFAHNSASLPIGTWRNVGVVGGKLIGDLHFAPTAAAQEARALVEANCLKMCSVGMLPGRWSWLGKPGEGIRFESGHALLECSLCAIGANPDALLLSSGTPKSMTSAQARRAREIELIRLRGAPC